MSNSHEWQFDNAWQEMLNHATIKVFIVRSTHNEKSLSFLLLMIILYDSNNNEMFNRRLWMLKNKKLIAMQNIN